jgi:hypothetical protein
VVREQNDRVFYEEAQQVTRGVIGPVQILEHDQHRRLLPETTQCAEQQLEDARLRGVCYWRTLVIVVRGEFGQQPGELGPGGAEDPRARRVIKRRDERPHRRDHGPVER